MNLTNLQILSHNICYAYLGVDQNNTPVIQTSALASMNSLEGFEYLLREFYAGYSGRVFQGKLSDLLVTLSAEYQTIQAVLRHLAYSNREFSPQLYGEEIYRPNNWIGQSYLRLSHLTHWGPCGLENIESSIRAVAANEAQHVLNVAKRAASNATELTLNDSAAYHALAGGEETV